MTLEELREACAKAVEALRPERTANDWTFEGRDKESRLDALDAAVDAIRAVPIPAVDDGNICSAHQDRDPACRLCTLTLPVDDEFAGHTPGPWVATNSGVQTEAGVWVGGANVHANACLMAAAPRLLRERDEARGERNQAWNVVGRIEEVLGYSGNRPIEETVRDVRQVVAERDEARAVLSRAVDWMSEVIEWTRRRSKRHVGVNSRNN